MEASYNKKIIGIGFITLFAVSIINSIISRIPIDFNSSMYQIRDYWFILSNFIKAASVIWIAFNKRANSSVLSKAGCILYVVLMSVNLTNYFSYIISKENLIYFPGISEYINPLLLYAPGIMLLIWGCKLWLPSKIIFSIAVIFEVILDMFWAKIAAMYRNFESYSFDEIESFQNITFDLSTIATILIFAALVLTVVWLCIKPKVDSAKNQIIDII